MGTNLKITKFVKNCQFVNSYLSDATTPDEYESTNLWGF